MASVTAFIIIGDPHPNDNGISPEWLIELWEGSRATLKLKSLTGSKRSRVIQVATPKAIFKNIKNILETIYPDSTKKSLEPYLKSLVITCLKGSSLEIDIDKFNQLARFDTHISTRIKSRTYSRWSSNWNG